MTESERGQLNRNAAQVYEEFFLPALFDQWVAPMADAAGVGAGDRVLDVACGTGVLARHLVDRVHPGGKVVGLDVNENMLVLGRQVAPEVEWHHGPAEALPFADESFDAVVSQFGLMFFDDREQALREMVRVLRPQGRLVVAVWASLEQAPGYKAMADLLARLFGREVAAALHAPYCLGDEEVLSSLFTAAGIREATIERRDGTARFPSVSDWVTTDVKGWTLADVLDDRQLERLKAAAGESLKAFIGTDGVVSFPHPALLVTATKG